MRSLKVILSGLLIVGCIASRGMAETAAEDDGPSTAACKKIKYDGYSTLNMTMCDLSQFALTGKALSDGLSTLSKGMTSTTELSKDESSSRKEMMVRAINGANRLLKPNLTEAEIKDILKNDANLAKCLEIIMKEHKNDPNFTLQDAARQVIDEGTAAGN